MSSAIKECEEELLAQGSNFGARMWVLRIILIIPKDFVLTPKVNSVQKTKFFFTSYSKTQNHAKMPDLASNYINKVN